MGKGLPQREAPRPAQCRCHQRGGAVPVQINRGLAVRYALVREREGHMHVVKVAMRAGAVRAKQMPVPESKDVHLQRRGVRNA